MNTFGERLKQFRISAGLTQEELAKKCGITKQNISRYENSKREPNIRTAKMIADALGVMLADLVPEEEVIASEPTDENIDLLVTLFNQLPPAAKESVIVQLRALAQHQKDQGSH